MTPITIITIVVVALLTIIVFGLAWLGYSSCIKAYRVETEAGKHDEEILKEYHSKKKSGLVGSIISYLALTLLAGLFTIGVVYKVRGETLAINNQTVLVIKSGSMADYYNDELANEYIEYPTYHFDVGDICVFEKTSENTELVKGEVYGYKYKDIIITHRLVDDTDGVYKFRGDNNPIADPYHIKRENIIYHYTGQKVPGIGAFILYAQSYFGLWSIIGIIGIAVSSEVVYHKLNKINKQRYKLINNPEEKVLEKTLTKEDIDKDKFSKAVAFILDIWPEKPKEQEEKSIKAQFKRSDGTLVTIYNKEPSAEAPSKAHEEKEGAENEK